jgi:hypothetical protein
MNDKKHIDRIFQERFKDFEVTPNNAVWENIEAQLNQKKKKRRAIPVWWRYAGAAALFLLFLTLGNLYFNNTGKKNTNQVVDTEKIRSIDNSENLNNTETKIATQNSNTEKTTEEINSKNQEQNIISNKTRVTESSNLANTNDSKNKPNLISNRKRGDLKTSSKEEKNNNTAISKNNNEANNVIIDEEKAQKLINNSSQKNTTVTETNNEKTETKNSKTEENQNAIEDALNKTKDIIEEENKLNRWSVAPNVAPVYFNTLGEGSSIDQQFNSNSKTGEVNMSYGINATYAINKKLSVRSGINKVNLGYNTNNVVVFQSVGASSSTGFLANIDSGSGNKADNLSVISGETFNPDKTPQAITTTSINQSLGYIEVPLEIEYALINKKLGINVIGGFSSLFLNNNDLFSESENGSKTLLGRANNINKVSYSANFGLGFNYEVSKKIDFNLEPIFKYQMNTFNNTSGDFKPYFIGVYTGFAIKF